MLNEQGSGYDLSGLDARIAQMQERERALAGEVEAELRTYCGRDPSPGSSVYTNLLAVRAGIITNPGLMRDMEIKGVPAEDPSQAAVSVAIGGRAPVVREAEHAPEAFCLATRDALRAVNEERRQERASREPPAY